MGGKDKMLVKRGKGSYRRVYRPCRVSEIYGQEEAKKLINDSFKNGFDQSLLFSGETGCGKTSMARIVIMGLNCRKKAPTAEPCCECDSCISVIRSGQGFDSKDINAARIKGVEDIRALTSEMGAYPMFTNVRCLVIDEAHNLNAKSENILYSELENPVPDSYYIFCSTNPDKFSEPLRDRLLEVEFERLDDEITLELLKEVCEKEALEYNEDVLKSIASKSKGRPRRALNLLQKAVGTGNIKRQVTKEKEILSLIGENNIIVIAPHAVGGDDDNVGIIAEKMNLLFNCYAVINNKYPRDKVNLNSIKEIKNNPDVEKEFLQPIINFKEEIVKEHGEALLIHVHGIKNKNIEKETDKETEILIGIGQGNAKLTANEKLAENLKNYLPKKMEGCRDSENNLRQTSQVIGESLLKISQETVEKESVIMTQVKISDIELKDGDDWKYIYRFKVSPEDDPELSERLAVEVESFADRIKNDGLAHPLILIRKKNGKYMILCGYRRYQALRRLGTKEVEAVIHEEDDLTAEQAMRLSLSENTERKNLSDIEIGHFLQSVKNDFGWTQQKLGRQFGPLLGFGTSHSAVNKRLRLYELWAKGESKDLILAHLRGEVNFGVISDELIFIKSAEDRNALFEQVLKPLRPAKAELHKIKNLLRSNGEDYKSALSKREVKEALIQAQSSNNNKSQELIKLLKIQQGDPLTKQKIDFNKKVDAIRKSLFGKDASDEDFSIVPPADMEKDEFTVHFKIARGGLEDTIKNITQFVGKKENIDELFMIIEGNPKNV
jgi:ParB family chromosome partitioning protein